MDNGNHKRREHWFGIGRQLLSFMVGVIVASFIVGGARQKVADLGRWKEEVAPKIERMDSKGTLSFELFEKNYEKREEANEERMKQIEQDLRSLERREHNH